MYILKALSSFLFHEFDVFFSSSWREWATIIAPGSVFSIAAMRGSNLPLLSILYNYLFLFSWLSSYTYFLELSNQIIGVEEDSINKPDRPIPSGKVTVTGAKVRWALVLSLFIGQAAYKPTLLPETITWILTTAFLCLTSAGNHWIGKNCIGMSVGTWTMLSASWKAFSPATPEVRRVLIGLSVCAAFIGNIQDLRDMKGDAVIGRKTLQLVYGDFRSRQIIAFLFLPLSFCALWMSGTTPFGPFPSVAVLSFLGYRVMKADSPRYDHETYMMVTYAFCGLLLCIVGGLGLDLKLFMDAYP